ncbi:MAG TPA: hypothetical protein VGG09_03250 [Acidimicrobiales bacterium]|jgi:Mce-associated membrane protein
MSEEVVLEVERDPDPVSGETAEEPQEDERADAAAEESGGATDWEGAPPVPQTPRDPSRRRRFGIVEILGLIVIAALVVVLIISRVQLSNQDAVNGDRASAVAAAQNAAIDVATYSYLHLHRDFGRVEAESTPTFRKSFIRSSDSLSKVLKQYKATASAKVLKAAVESISGSKAVVLLFVNQSVANSTQKGVSTDDSRIEVTLVRSGDRWLLQNLKLL